MSNDKWRLVNYFDVWGNEVDGYEVNDSCVELDDLVISDNATSDDLVDYLISIGFLNEKAKGNVEVTDNGDWIEFMQKDNGYPLCRLERVI